MTSGNLAYSGSSICVCVALIHVLEPYLVATFEIQALEESLFGPWGYFSVVKVVKNYVQELTCLTAPMF